MEKTLQELAALLHGTLENGSDLKITGVNGLAEAGPTEISFAVQPYVEVCGKSRAGAMILAHGEGELKDRPVIRVENPREAFAELLELFRPREEMERVISPLACIAADARIGKNVAVMPFAVIDKGAEVGDNTVIYPHVYVGRHVRVGSDCIIYPNVTIRENCVVGNRDILQAGNRDAHQVAIGCNTCIDRATVDSTIVGNGTKMDNLVHLGHNDVVGENNLFVALVGIPGSVHIGNNNTFGGQAATVGHITIGNNNTFAGRCGVINNVGDNQVLAGFPSMPHLEWLRQQSKLRKITEITKNMKELKKQMAALEAQLESAKEGK